MNFYFYDLETSGINPRAQRIMQFAGQRTNDSFEPVSEPDNILIKLTDEVLPDPEAIMVTGITPQKTLEDGLTEYEFLKYFHEHVLGPDLVIIGFNNIRFDDEFIRNLHWRNYYDPYQWHWQDGRSRWDLLDASRMMRAIRPGGIKWPFLSKNNVKVPTNRLELITAENGIDHIGAHDAFSDVKATIEVAKLMRSANPDMFDYLLKMRKKAAVENLVSKGQPFVYTSGRYSSDSLKTTVAISLTKFDDGGHLVYNLTVDPDSISKKLLNKDLTIEDLMWPKAGGQLVVKVLKPNNCPAVAPLGVLDSDAQNRVGLELGDIEKNYRKLISNQTLKDELIKLVTAWQKERAKGFSAVSTDVDFGMYDGFIPKHDQAVMSMIRSSGPDEISSVAKNFEDKRLQSLAVRYKARNFPQSMDGDEMDLWQGYRVDRLSNGVKGQRSVSEYIATLQEISSKSDTSEDKMYLLEELRLYLESITPSDY